MIVGHIGGSSSGGYEIQKSLRFRASASAHLSRTPSVTGNRKTWTWSGWFKGMPPSGTNAQLFSTTLYNSGSNSTYLTFAGQTFTLASVISGTAHIVLTSAALFRDPSAWYHLMVTVDTTHATPSSRVKLYVNGSQITSLSAATYPAQNYDTHVNSVVGHFTGSLSVEGVPQQFLDGYLSEINFIDGQALDPSYFGQVSAETGAWIPKKYTGTYGTNGFYLPFNDGSTLANLAADRSGNGNNWTANNISLTAGVTYDWMDDTPTNNFAVLNPLISSSATYLSSANQLVSGLPHTYEVRGTMPLPTSGKWYWETMPTNDGIAACIGVSTAAASAITPYYPGSSASTFGYQASSGNKVNGGSTAAYGSAYGSTDVIGVAVDTSAGRIWFSKNGVWQAAGDPATGLNEAFSWSGVRDYLTPAIGRTYAAAAVLTAAYNFGQRPFAYSPPTGFKALCTKNLPTPSILNPKKHFDVKTYVGDGAASGRNISCEMSPDLGWIKSRSIATGNHFLFDTLRTGPTKVLGSNQTIAEYSNSDLALGTNQFTVGDNGGGDEYNPNKNLSTYVSWLWKAGGAPVTNNAGSIQSQVSANPTAGFSIVTYTGTGANATVGHGLGVAPKMVIVKDRDSVVNWVVSHGGIGSTDFLRLNTTDAKTTDATIFAGAHTSSVITIGSGFGVNGSTKKHVAYCFAEIPGYSKIGSYTGNGSTDGPFVYCGFRPRYVLIKRTDVGAQWLVFDTARSSDNPVDDYLVPNTSDLEQPNNADRRLDLLSNGFKLRAGATALEFNTSGGSYIFYAVAEQPFQFANAR